MHEPSPTDVLLATTVHWASTTRLALALAEAGLRVAVVAPAEHALHRMDALSHARTCLPHTGFVSAVAEAVTALRPAMVVPGDDRAVRGLHALHDRIERGSTARRNVAEAIRRSLGEPSSFAIVDLKSRFATFCQHEGLPLPRTVVVRNRREFLQCLHAEGLPQVLKLDIGSGGRCVRIVRTAGEASAAFDELAQMRGWCSVLRRGLEELSTTPVVDKVRGRAPAISSQCYVVGRLANRAMYCRDGKVLAGITVVTMHVLEETGPTTVARVLDHPEVEDLAARIVRRLKLSGFIGIDVVLEEGTGRPWLLELNPRPTQTSHLALSHDLDMVGALATELRGATRRAVPRTANPYGRIIALYPGELWRSPSSDYLRAPYHDIPLHEPKFIAAYARPVPEEPLSWVQSLARRWPLRRARWRLASVQATDPAEGRAIGTPSSETAGIT
jgi:glutathione synthase/RimK-type ligase-like ATP-grasp enzyme